MLKANENNTLGWKIHTAAYTGKKSKNKRKRKRKVEHDHESLKQAYVKDDIIV